MGNVVEGGKLHPYSTLELHSYSSDKYDKYEIIPKEDEIVISLFCDRKSDWGTYDKNVQNKSFIFAIKKSMLVNETKIDLSTLSTHYQIGSTVLHYQSYKISGTLFISNYSTQSCFFTESFRGKLEFHVEEPLNEDKKLISINKSPEHEVWEFYVKSK